MSPRHYRLCLAALCLVVAVVCVGLFIQQAVAVT